MADRGPLLRTGTIANISEILSAHVKELSAQQELLYASNRYALLIIFQAMDAAGKDGAIAHVMSGINPQGCRVSASSHPSAEELKHDFLWRTTRELPERGQIGIFNRSYYEEVLIVRVHPEILRAEGLPDELLDEKTHLARPVSLDRGSGAASHAQWHADHQILSASLQGRAAQALPQPHRNARKELEVLLRGYRGAAILEGIHEGIREMPERHQHP